MRSWWAAWGPAAAWAAFLFFLSSRSTVGVDLSGGLDKVGHVAAYVVLGILLARATTRLRLTPLLAVSLGLLYGFLDELHQSIVPGRTAEFADWVADAVGTVAGLLLYLFVRRMRASRAGDVLAKPADSTSI